MSAYIRRLLGMIKVEESSTKITISGLHSKLLQADLLNHWNTGKISINILTDIRGSSFSFYKFYALEVLYIFSTLIKSERNVRSQRRFLLEAIRQLREVTWLKSLTEPTVNRLDDRYLSNLVFSPLEHQAKFYKHYDEYTQRMQLNGYFLGAAPGLGKTKMGITLFGMLGLKVKIYIVPNNSIEEVWRSSISGGEIIKKEKAPEAWYSSDNKDPEIGKEFYILHYEYLGKFLDFVNNNLKYFKGAGVCIDEASNFNLAHSKTSQRSDNLIELCQLIKSPHVLWMDGTPFRAAGSEAIPFIKTTDPFFTRFVEEGFKKIFGKSATRALDILAHRIGLVLFEVDKSTIVTTDLVVHDWDVELKDGEKYTLKAIRIEMAEYARDRSYYYKQYGPEMVARYHSTIEWFKVNCKTVRGYADLDKYIYCAKALNKARDYRHVREEMLFCNEYEDTVISPNLPNDKKKLFASDKSVYKYVRLKIQGEILGRIVMRARIECNRDLVDGLDHIKPRPDDSGKPHKHAARSDIELMNSMEAKTIIFTSYVEVADKAFDRYTKLGYSPIVVYGETNKDLSSIMDKFRDDPEINPLIATFKSLSTAVPVISANGVFFLNQPERDRTRVQAISRAHRLGQKHTVRVNNFFLYTNGQENISVRSLDIITWSKEQVDLILGKTSIDITSSTESYYEPAKDFSIEELDKIAQESLAGDTEALNEYMKGRELFESTPTKDSNSPVYSNERKSSVLSSW